MANGNSFVQRAPLPPLNSPTITEGDRARVYDAIGKELNNILNGATSYYPDSTKKSSKDLTSELNDFIGAVGALKDAVDDPGNIVGDAVSDLRKFQKAFEAGVSNDIETMWNDPLDSRDKNIELPNSLAPITEDYNIIHVDPEPDGQFSVPNPLSPNQWPKDLKASAGSAANGAMTDNYPRLLSRVGGPTLGSVNPLNTNRPVPMPPSGRPLGIFTGKPMPDYPLPASIWGLPDNSDSSGNWFTRLGGPTEQPQASPLGLPSGPAPPLVALSNPDSLGDLSGRIPARAGNPDNRDRAIPQPGGLLGLFLRGQR